MSASKNRKIKTGDAAPEAAHGKMRVHKGLKYGIYPNREQQEKLAV